MFKSISEKFERIILLVLAFAVLAVFGTFLFHFYDLKIGTDLTNWGQFGDYFGGTLNPIIGLVTAYFAYQAYQNTRVSAQQQKFVATLEIFFKAYEFQDKNFKCTIPPNKSHRSFGSLGEIYQILKDSESEDWCALGGTSMKSLLLSLEPIVESISAQEDWLSNGVERYNFYKIIRAHMGRDFCGIIRMVLTYKGLDYININLHHFKKINANLNPNLPG